MDLILLQPGDSGIFSGLDSLTYGNALIDNGRWTVDQNNVLSQNAGGLGGWAGQCIELVSLNQGMSQPFTTNLSTATRTSGRPIFTEFTCQKYVDRTSVKLYEYCLRGRAIGEGKIASSKIFIFRKSNEKFVLLMMFELRDAIISEIQFQTHSDDMPTEQFKLNFTEIMWTYSEQGSENGVVGHCTSGWSILRNEPIARLSD